jgi:hypothetical protein
MSLRNIQDKKYIKNSRINLKYIRMEVCIYKPETYHKHIRFVNLYG